MNVRSGANLNIRTTLFLKDIKGTGSPDENVLKFLGCLEKEKINLKVLHASLKTLNNSKDCSKRRESIYVLAFLRIHWSNFSSVMYISYPAFGTILEAHAAFGTTFRGTGGYLKQG
jgi:hypothetical protein